MNYAPQPEWQHTQSLEQLPATTPRTELLEQKRDTPDPIVFDDAIGTTAISFLKRSIDRESGVAAFNMEYAHCGETMSKVKSIP